VTREMAKTDPQPSHRRLPGALRRIHHPLNAHSICTQGFGIACTSMSSGWTVPMSFVKTDVDTRKIAYPPAELGLDLTFDSCSGLHKALGFDFLEMGSPR
jgi:hypothetical protein